MRHAAALYTGVVFVSIFGISNDQSGLLAEVMTLAGSNDCQILFLSQAEGYIKALSPRTRATQLGCFPPKPLWREMVLQRPHDTQRMAHTI